MNRFPNKGICDRTWEKGPIGVVDLFFLFLHFWNLHFITSLWIPEQTLEVLPSLSYRRLNTRSYKNRKWQKSIFNISGQIGRSFRAHRVRVTKGRGSKKTVVYFVVYAYALNRTYLQGRIKKEWAISKLHARYEGAGSKTSHEGK